MALIPSVEKGEKSNKNKIVQDVNEREELGKYLTLRRLQ